MPEFDLNRPPPTDLPARWAPFFNAVMRQESIISRVGSRIVRPEDRKLLNGWIRTFWDPVITATLSAGPELHVDRWPEAVRAAASQMRAIVTAFHRAKTAADEIRLSWIRPEPEDMLWWDVTKYS